jgi:hypothetical protein
MSRTRLCAACLLVLGVAQIAGDLLGWRVLRGLAAATGASPAPKVFSAVRGFETYSTQFFLEGAGKRIELTPSLYSRMRGPYNRRNVYGAALAYAPVLAPELRDPVMRHALCGKAPLLHELGLKGEFGDGQVTVSLKPLRGTSLEGLQTTFTPDCGD